MNANDVIESYVTDVAVQLPRKQRNDVAFELRALLNEELQERAGDAGREPDADMAIRMLREHGRPADVAARYLPTLTIIDPADGHAFARATILGLVVIWVAGLVSRLQQPIGTAGEFWGALGQWWGATVVVSLWWPGMLLLGFALSAWLRRRWPQTGEWKPRAGDRIAGSRASLVLAIVGILCGLYILAQPTWLLDVFWGGRAAPVAYQALTYTDTFLHRQAPWLLLLLLLNVPMFLVVIVHGRWSPRMRRIETVGTLLLCAVMTWAVLDGPIFRTQASDEMTKLFLVIITGVSLASVAIREYRAVRPGPKGAMHAGR
jgi:hypothetical protein